MVLHVALDEDLLHRHALIRIIAQHIIAQVPQLLAIACGQWLVLATHNITIQLLHVTSVIWVFELHELVQ